MRNIKGTIFFSLYIFTLQCDAVVRSVCVCVLFCFLHSSIWSCCFSFLGVLFSSLLFFSSNFQFSFHPFDYEYVVWINWKCEIYKSGSRSFVRLLQAFGTIWVWWRARFMAHTRTLYETFSSNCRISWFKECQNKSADLPCHVFIKIEELGNVTLLLFSIFCVCVYARRGKHKKSSIHQTCDIYFLKTS